MVWACRVRWPMPATRPYPRGMLCDTCKDGCEGVGREHVWQGLTFEEHEGFFRRTRTCSLCGWVDRVKVCRHCKKEMPD